jgi:hypothetical protein
MAQGAFNYRMARVRIVVEWSFGELVNWFSCLAHHRQLKIHEVPVDSYQVASSLMLNLVNCSRRNRIERYFDCPCPTITEYLAILGQPAQPNTVAGVRQYI